VSEAESERKQVEYDAKKLSRRESFTNLSRWLADAKALASPNLVTVLVGNKADMEEEREVEWSEASRWAAENGTGLF
jgi:Ras-related protein Rab-4A/Ras-related protein Rab-4B